MKKIIISLIMTVLLVCNTFALGAKTESYELIPIAPCEFEIKFTTHDDFMAFVNGHAEFVKVRYIDEATLTAGIFIDESCGMCLL